VAWRVSLPLPDNPPITYPFPRSLLHHRHRRHQQQRLTLTFHSLSLTHARTHSLTHSLQMRGDAEGIDECMYDAKVDTLLAGITPLQLSTSPPLVIST